MTGEVVVLLSSDDSDPFVTPHIARTGGRPSQQATSRATPTIEDRSTTIPATIVATPEASGLTRGSLQRTSRCGFLGFSDDDLSSPFPTFSAPKPLQNQPQPKRTPRQVNETTEEPSVVILSDDCDTPGFDDGTKDTQRRNDLVDVILDEGDSRYERRPSKRPRLSPQPRSGTTTTPLLAGLIDESCDSPDLPRRIPPLPESRKPPCTMNAIEAEGLKHLQSPRRTIPAATHVDCIDLLSSSDSDLDRAGSPKETMDPYTTLEDTHEFITTSIPIAQKRQEVATGQRKEQSVEILLLSSSPFPPRPAGTSFTKRTVSDRGADRRLPSRQDGSDSHAAYREPLRPVRSKPLQRSLSTGHRLPFLDDDDDEDMGISPSFNKINNLLAAWRKSEEPPKRPTPKPASRGATRGEASTNKRKADKDKERPRISNSTATEAEKETMRKEKEAEREQRRKDKEADKEKRLQEREVEKERRRIAKEIAKEKKAQERAVATAFNDANKSRTDKSVAVPEMIVQLPTSLPQATKEVLEPMLSEIKAGFQTWTSPLDNVVTWRRKVTAEYKSDLGHWAPVPLRIEEEKHALIFLRGDELVQHIVAKDVEGEEDSGYLGGHVQAMRQSFPGYSLLYLIEGLAAWKSKNRSIRNRQFAAAVRNAGAEDAELTGSAATAARTARGRGGRAGRSTAQKQQQHVDEGIVEDALLELQVEHGVMIHETTNALDTARWIRVFTEQIATAPYRQQKEELYAAAASFCMDAGQIPTGDGGSETYSLMLQQIARVTEPVALGVAARFDSVPKLVRGFEAEGPLVLEACLKSRNRNGALSDRTVGPALSKRIYNVFMGEDENA